MRTLQQYITELQPVQCFSFTPTAWLQLQEGSAHTSRLIASSGAAAVCLPRVLRSLPRDWADVTVLGCRWPSKRRNPLYASRKSGSASASLPWSCSSAAMLLMDVNVLWCLSPRVSRRPANASWSSG